MTARLLRSRVTWVLLALVAGVAISRTGSAPTYEYEEVIYLELDGSATVDVNASIASIAAVHGADLGPDPEGAPAQAVVRALFAAPGVEVSALTFFGRGGRRFVHVSLDVSDVRRLPASPSFAASAFRFERRGDRVVFRRTRGGAAGGAAAGDAGNLDAGGGAWTGDERAAVRVRVPSTVLFENATSDVQRGNMLVWEQPLAERLSRVPIELHVDMASSSILSSTLVLFGAAVAAAALMFAVVIALVVRKGRAALPSPGVGGRGVRS
jgi:hypothetical protein